MIKETAKKILPSNVYNLVKNILKPIKIDYYSTEEISARVKHFGLKKAAILTDGQTDIPPLLSIPDLALVGIYTFNLEAIGRTLGNFKIEALPTEQKIETDGWIVSSLNPTDGFSLNRHLLESESENQFILQHVKLPNSTKYYSYADFFSNEQKTIVQINNYFRRCYNITFPIDLKLTLRNTDGKILETKQVILPPDSIKVIKSEDFKSQNFIGYLEVEFEIAKKVVPFLHYMIDYISPDFISSNHQSGLGLHPANSRFTRGYVPTNKEESLEVCLFQRHYEEPVTVKAILNYKNQNGEEKEVAKDFPQIARNHMVYQDVKKLFGEVDFSKAISPTITTECDKPLHRPNYYYSRKGNKGYYDTSHAGPDLRNHVRLAYKGNPEVSLEEKEKFEKLGVAVMDLKHYILPKDLNIDSIILLGGNDTTCPINEFEICLHDYSGKLIKSFISKFDFEKERYINLNKYLASKNLSDFAGTISFRSANKNERVPISAETITGYIHRESNYLTSTAGNGSHPDNIPAYYRGGSPNDLRTKCRAGVSDIFARGISNEEFDTFYIVSYQSADKNLSKKIKYEIQITNTVGEKKILYRELSPNGSDVLKLSEMLGETRHHSQGGFYTIWLFSPEAHIYAQHILIRKSDFAIAAEHCYAGKFGL